MRKFAPPLSWVLWSATALLLGACESVVNLELPPYEPTLVVLANCPADQPVEVILTTDQPLTESRPAQPVTDATISLRSSSGFLETLTLVTDDPDPNVPPYYRGQNFALAEGETYTLEISAPGFPAITATDSVPFRTVPVATQFSSSSVPDGVATELVTFTVELELPNDPDRDEFFQLNLYQRLSRYRIDSDGNVVPSPAPDTLLSFEPITERLDATSLFNDQGLLFTDQSFRNHSTGIVTVQGTFALRPALFLADEFVVELRSVSQSYYLFQQSMVLQRRNQTDPLASPIILNGNVTNGLGVFSAYTIDTLTFSTDY